MKEKLLTKIIYIDLMVVVVCPSSEDDAACFVRRHFCSSGLLRDIHLATKVVTFLAVMLHFVSLLNVDAVKGPLTLCHQSQLFRST